MKLIAIILLPVLFLFLLAPTLTVPNGVPAAHDCCRHKAEGRKETGSKDCNPFVNCCYRTFEVTVTITHKPVMAVVNHPVYTSYTCVEHPGFISNCWHPPRLAA